MNISGLVSILFVCKNKCTVTLVKYRSNAFQCAPLSKYRVQRTSTISQIFIVYIECILVEIINNYSGVQRKSGEIIKNYIGVKYIMGEIINNYIGVQRILNDILNNYIGVQRLLDDIKKY
jgi:hypothetical protein